MAVTPAFESDLPAGLAPRLIAFCEQLRSEGLAVGTSEILDAFEALEHVPWSDREDFREALAATVAKSQEDRRVFELLFDRFFFRAAEAEALAAGRSARASATRAPTGSTSTSCARRSARRSSPATTARCATSRGWRSPPSAARARARASSAWTSSGSAARSACRPRRRPPDGDCRASRRSIARQINRFERHLRRELERGADRAHPEAAALAAPGRARPRAADQPHPGPLRGAPRRRPAQAPARDARPRAARARRKASVVDMRRTMRASLETGGVPLRLRYRPKRPRRPEIYVLCDVSTSVTSASVFFLSVLHALHDSFRRLRSFVFIERISEVTDVFERERDFREISQRISQRGRRRRRLRLHRLRPRLARVRRADRRRARPALDDHRPRRRPHQRPRAARRRLRPRRRARRPHLLAQPRAAPLLELRRLGDVRLRAPLHRAPSSAGPPATSRTS